MQQKLISTKASIVIPAYNQFTSLEKVLLSLSRQSISPTNYQIIIIDDGSNDPLADQTSDMLQDKYNCEILLYHGNNGGRAAARNIGIKLSRNDIIIFCDSDRVPCEDFVYQHLIAHNDNNCVVIGNQYDIFYKNIANIFHNEIDWISINRFSRLPNYFSRISKIYDKCTQGANNLYWLSFLVGNSSLHKNSVNSVGGFDEDFKKWGFEHFELGYRLHKAGITFKLLTQASNYHIPHQRDEHFYEKMITDSAQLLIRKHPEINISVMKKILMENVNVLDYSSEILFQ